MGGKATNRHVFLRVVMEVEMSRGRFGSVVIVNFAISKMFAETVTQSAARIADVFFFTSSTGYAVDKVSGNTREIISDSNSSRKWR